MYVYCMVCYHVMAAPYVRSVDCVFAYPYALVDDSEWTMSFHHYPKFFLWISLVVMCHCEKGLLSQFTFYSSGYAILMKRSIHDAAIYINIQLLLKLRDSVRVKGICKFIIFYCISKLLIF